MTKKALTQERIGELFILSEMILLSAEPIVMNYSVKIVPPILFAGLSIFLAGIFLMLYMIFTKKAHELLNKQALKYMIGVTVFIIIIPKIFIYQGSKLTSGINTAILIQAEVLFTFIICGLFYHDKITAKKILSAMLILIGATVILYNGSLSLNTGEIMIIAGTIFYPIGNIHSKEALKHVSPATILFFRSFAGGLALIFISIIFETSYTQIAPTIQKTIIPIMINGLLVMGISKILWYEGLRRTEITKAISLNTAFPAFSLIFAAFFLKELPSEYQIIGLIIILGGGDLSHQKIKNSRTTTLTSKHCQHCLNI